MSSSNKRLAVVLLALLLSACGDLTMRNQPKVDPLERSDAFAYDQSARPVVDHTVPREAPAERTWIETGTLEDGAIVVRMPQPVTAALLERGRDQFDVYCSPCHGVVGDGEGMVVRRGFPRPPSFHTEQLRQAPDGYFFDVITNGKGDMYAYGPQVEPADRWAIIAYIRVLQMSQHTPAETLSPAEEEALEEMEQP